MHKLDDLSIQNKLDQSGMYEKIIHLPEQVLKAYYEPVIHIPPKRTQSDFSRINKLMICGMGGSAIAGDIAQAAFHTKLPVTVCKDYQLAFIDERTLVIVLSYSGNTEETLACLKTALSKTPFIAGITSGGKLKDLVNNEYYWIELPQGYPPRSAIGYLFFSLMKLLEDHGIIPDHDQVVKATIANLIKKAGAIARHVPWKENLAKSSAEEIIGKVPLIYTSNPRFFPLGYRWKCQVNENAKYPAFAQTVPEMNHNEIESWENKDQMKDFIPIFLRDLEDPPHYGNRIVVFKEILSANRIEYLDFIVEGNSLVEKIFSLIYLGDMISYYLAILCGSDPTSIEYIEHFKIKIKELGST